MEHSDSKPQESNKRCPEYHFRKAPAKTERLEKNATELRSRFQNINELLLLSVIGKEKGVNDLNIIFLS